MEWSMEQGNRRIEMLARGRIGRALFSLAAPAMAGMTVMAVYNLADALFVSFLRDTTAIAATGIVFPLFQLIAAVGLTFGIGAASVISRRLGEQRVEAAREAGATAFYSALLLGVVLSVFGGIHIRRILVLLGATESILDSATLYGRVIIGGSLFQVLNMTVNNLLRSEGASLHSSMGQMLGAFLNILLDPLFIFTFGMGVTGAAVATVLAQGVSTLYLLSYYLAGRGVLNPLHPGHVRLRRHVFRGIMVMGVPTFVRQVLGSVSVAFLNNAAAAFGDAAIAAISVTFRVFMFFFLALVGLAHGLQPLVGYNYGARRYGRVRAAMRLAFQLATVGGLLAGSLAFMFSPQIMHLVAPQDEQVVRMGVLAMRLMSLAFAPVGLVLMFGAIFQALGDGRAALVLAGGQQGFFLIPLILILPRFFGIAGLFAAQPAGFMLAFLVGLLLLRRTLGKLADAERGEQAGLAAVHQDETRDGK